MQSSCLGQLRVQEHKYSCSDKQGHPLGAGACCNRRQIVHILSLPALLSAQARASQLKQGGSKDQSARTLEQTYDQYAGSYDVLDSGAVADVLGFPELRRELIAQAHGSVLELAVGTGLNLPLYNPSHVHSLTALDISTGMLQQAQKRAKVLGDPFPVNFIQGDVAALPFESASFDCVVDTFSLCVFPDPAAALKEAARVVKPGGTVLLVEHQRSPFTPLAWYQDFTAEAVAATGKGCFWNQDVGGLLRGAGLQVVTKKESLGGLMTLVKAERLT